VEALRIKGPPVETFKLDAEIDATDQLEFPDASDQNRTAVQQGIYPQLVALERLVYPSTDTLNANNDLAAIGTLEIAPIEAPLTVFVWSKNRVAPVRITEFSITEEAFDPNLNPIRAKVSLSMRVLSTTDLGFEQRGSGIYLAYQQTKERLAQLAPAAVFTNLGITNIP
jgi:hypothetical protein